MKIKIIRTSLTIGLMMLGLIADAEAKETFLWQGRFRLCAELSKNENWVCTSEDWILGSKLIFSERNKAPCYLSLKEEKFISIYSWVRQWGSQVEGTAIVGSAVSQNASSLPLTIVYAWDVYGQEEYDHIVFNGRELYLDYGWRSDQALEIEMCKNTNDVLRVF